VELDLEVKVHQVEHILEMVVVMVEDVVTLLVDMQELVVVEDMMGKVEMVDLMVEELEVLVAVV
tara:strand:+ start:302 stop:493 length:192 start_codon:yes stop_codon:yes gene_type:complete